MKFFFPRQDDFFLLFAELNTIQEEMVTLLLELAKKFANTEDYAKRAKEIEHKGDEKTHAIIEKLNKTFITPFDREDIYELTHELDDIIDLIENLIREFHLYHIKDKPVALDEFVPLISLASQNLNKMLVCLKAQKHTPELENVKIKIHDLEDEGDAIYEKSIFQLFQSETDPITLIKQKEILEKLENVMDKYQRVSDIIESLVVKSS